MPGLHRLLASIGLLLALAACNAPSSGSFPSAPIGTNAQFNHLAAPVQGAEDKLQSDLAQPSPDPMKVQSDATALLGAWVTFDPAEMALEQSLPDSSRASVAAGRIALQKQAAALLARASELQPASQPG
jgi:hypothetical protein